MNTESPHGHNRYSVTARLLLDGRLVPGALVVEGDRIVEVRTDAVGELPGPRLEAEIVSPGLIDLQCNGAFGFEVGGDAEALRALAARLPSTGVTTFLPTVVSALPAHYRSVAAALARPRGCARSHAARGRRRHARRRARRAAGLPGPAPDDAGTGAPWGAR